MILIFRIFCRIESSPSTSAGLPNHGDQEQVQDDLEENRSDTTFLVTQAELVQSLDIGQQFDIEEFNVYLNNVENE